MAQLGRLVAISRRANTGGSETTHTVSIWSSYTDCSLFAGFWIRVTIINLFNFSPNACIPVAKMHLDHKASSF